MKYFIDCGCNNGDTIEKFLTGQILSHIKNPTEYYIIGFDLYKDFEQPVLDIISKYGAKGHFVPAAIDTYDGEATAAIAHDNSVSSSINELHNKASAWYFDHHEKVSVMDLSSYIKTLDNPEILLKMDIEGSEYNVLPKMITDLTIFSVKELMIEYHYSFSQINKKTVRKWYREYKDFITNYLTDIGIPVQEYK